MMLEQERKALERERAEDKARVAAAVAAAAVAVPPPAPAPTIQREPSKATQCEHGAHPTWPSSAAVPPEARTRLTPTASGFISGLLFGSFCMIHIITSRRWELANHLT